MKDEQTVLYRRLKAGERVWVRNMSNPQGVLTISLGGQDSVTVPKTKNPFCLTDQASEKALLESISLRKFLALSVLKLVSNEEAHEYFRITGTDAADSLRPSPAMVLNDTIQQNLLKDEFGVPNSPSSASGGIGRVSPAVIQMLLNLHHPSVTTEQVINHLTAVWDSFTKSDIQYVMAKIENNDVVAWMAQRVAALQEAEKMLAAEGAKRVKSSAPSIVSPPVVAPSISAQLPPAPAKPKKKVVRKRTTRKRVTKKTTRKEP